MDINKIKDTWYGEEKGYNVISALKAMLEAEGACVPSEMLEGISGKLDSTDEYGLIVSSKPEGVRCHLRLHNESDGSSAFGSSCTESIHEEVKYVCGEVEFGKKDQYIDTEARFSEDSSIAAIIRRTYLREETGCPDSWGVHYRIVVYAPVP